jgi:sterol 14-demethylase
MSIVVNDTAPFSDAWAGYLAHAQANLPPLNTRAILLLLVNAPLLAIVLNILRQLVS